MAENPPTRDWSAVVAAKQAVLISLLEPYALPPDSLPPATQLDVSSFFDDGLGKGALSPLEHEMTSEREASKLLQKLRSREWKATDLLLAYIKRAAITHQLTPSLTEPCFAQALARAEYLDSLPEPIGPLHGLPITLKDQFNLPGVDTTLTYTALAFSPATTTSTLVQCLASLGAIPFAKTTLPQSILWCETDSPMFGLTSNPFNRAFTPGGSTGGEAVLLSMSASILGWGTDIGGSIRIPSSFMGLYGFKPSSSRLPYKDVSVTTDGQEHIPSSIGPLARSLDTITLAMRSILSHTELWKIDPRVVPIPWRESRFQDTISRPLRFGLLLNDGVVTPHPPITRCLQALAEKLTSAGYTVIPVDARLHEEAVAIADAFYTSDGGEDLRKGVESGGEPYLPHVQKLVNRAPAISVYEYWQLNKRKWKLQEAYAKKWDEAGIDLLLSPVMPHASVRHQECRWVGYTKVWNVVDYPAGVVPVGIVGETEDELEAGEGEMEQWNKGLWERNKEDMRGWPVCIQVVGYKLEEEMALAGMEVVDGIVKGAGGKL